MAEEIGNSNLITTWASSGDKIEPTPAKKDQGWQGGERPPHASMNFLQNEFGGKVNHILRNGIPEWNTSTTYEVNDYVKYQGVFYKCLIANSATSPLPENASWEAYLADKDLSNVDINALFEKFEDTEQIEWAVNANKLEATFVLRDNEYYSSDFSLTSSDNGKIVQIYVSIGESLTINLPNFTSLPDNWRIQLNIIGCRGELEIKPQGGDDIQRGTVALGVGSSLYFNSVESTIVQISKSSLLDKFAINGAATETNYISPSTTVNSPISKPMFENFSNSFPYNLNSSVGEIFNADEILRTGIYSFSGLSPVNIPTESTYGWLTVLGTNEGVSIGIVHQTFIDRTTNKIYTRVRLDNSWSDWMATVNMVIVRNISLDTLVYTGEYNVAGQGSLDAPSEDPYGWLKVMRFKQSDQYNLRCFQEWVPSTSDELYTRIRSDSNVWSAWIKRW